MSTEAHLQVFSTFISIHNLCVASAARQLMTGNAELVAVNQDTDRSYKNYINNDGNNNY